MGRLEVYPHEAVTNSPVRDIMKDQVGSWDLHAYHLVMNDPLQCQQRAHESLAFHPYTAVMRYLSFSIPINFGVVSNQCPVGTRPLLSTVVSVQTMQGSRNTTIPKRNEEHPLPPLPPSGIKRG